MPGQKVTLHVDESILGKSSHHDMACQDCHSSLDLDTHPDGSRVKAVDCVECHSSAIGEASSGLHPMATAKHAGEKVNCTACHGSHAILPLTKAGSQMHYTAIVDTCGRCHPKEADESRKSVHGTALMDGVREAPTCTDCHSEHTSAKADPISLKQISEQVCSRCHASTRMNFRYGLAGGEVESYRDSYHGLASRGGETQAAHCASCHGVHNIRASKDPLSSIHPSNLRDTCGKCHPGAGSKFTLGKIHHNGKNDLDDIGSMVNYWVKQVYICLIVIVLGFMVIHNFLAWRKKALAAFRSPDRVVKRMSTSMRVQHALLAVSFIFLSISGFALQFPDSWFGTFLGSTESIRRVSHRWTGVFLLLLGVYHLLYLAFSADGRRWFKDMLPKLEDIRHIWENIRYFCVPGAKRPQFHRFGYPEKLEYWAVVWGMGIMGITGLAIWLKIGVTLYLPRWMIDVAITVHYYEAILAVFAIVIWHLYHVVFDPDIYPANWSFVDGTVSREWYEHEHGLDTESHKTKDGKTDKS
ncbi:MAG: cytochrome b/b6 domain-containing protein [Verrucomicrobiota bacterium]|nr:cytochrome b/b6 domain-containing protein [Verrucomicrobiota bacterium]